MEWPIRVKEKVSSACRYSAISCADAVPVSSALQAGDVQRAPTPEPENRKLCANGDADVASKPSTKPQKGIMGMFANKSAPKKQDSGKAVTSEQKEDAPVCLQCGLLIFTKE